MQTKSNMLVVGILIVIVGVGILFGGKLLAGKGSDTKRSDTKKENKMSIGAVESMGTASTGANSEEKTEVDSKAKESAVSNPNGAFVASKSGAKYFPVTCSSAKTLKKENALYFNTPTEAEAAGYTQSSKCKY